MEKRQKIQRTMELQHFFQRALEIPPNALDTALKSPSEKALLLDLGHAGHCLDKLSGLMREKRLAIVTNSKTLKDLVDQQTASRLPALLLPHLPLLSECLYCYVFAGNSLKLRCEKDSAIDKLQQQMAFLTRQFNATIGELQSHHLPACIHLHRVYDGTGKELLDEGIPKLAFDKMFLYGFFALSLSLC